MQRLTVVPELPGKKMPHVRAHTQTHTRMHIRGILRALREIQSSEPNFSQGMAELPKLPGKKILNANTHAHLRKRVGRLAEYLQSILMVK